MNAPAPPPPREKVRFQIGQAVSWSPSPTGFAQVEDLHRCRVTIGYIRQGRWCRVRVRAVDIYAEPMLFALDNPFRRGRFPRAKEFDVTP